MDRAVASMDIVRMCALARLNWRLIDEQLLTMTGNRATAATQQAAVQATLARQAQQQAQLLHMRHTLADQRTNAVLGQAALAVGDDPSKYMVHTAPMSAYQPVVDHPGAEQVAQLYASVHQALARAAALHGESDPEVAPVVSARAIEILDNRVSPAELARLLHNVLPPQARALADALPQLVPALSGPILKASAAAAVPLGELYRRMPDALLPGQAAPATSPAASAPRSGVPPRTIGFGSPGFDTPLVDALLAQAMADPAHADELYQAALEAAGKTPTIDDDIAVLAQLARAAAEHPPGEAVIRRAVTLMSELAPRTERREDVARLLAWLAEATVAGGLVEACGPSLLKACQAVLTASGLEVATLVRLTIASAVLLNRSGKSDKATQLIDMIERGITDRILRRQLATVRQAVGRGDAPEK